MKLIFALSMIILSGCSSPKTKEINKSPERKAGQFITKAQMLHRSNLVKNVHYELDMDLTSKSETYSGKVKILFDLKVKDDIRIDFFKGKILKVVSNDVETSRKC